MIAPLEVLPAPVREVVLWTPFPYLIHFPASILIGLPVDARPRFVGNVGLECGVFCVESLALATGFEAVFGHGSLNNN